VARFVVTGGAGFIGSHLVKKLLMLGHDVVVYDDLSMGKRERVPDDATFVCADICDIEELSDAIRGADGIFHLAAKVSVRSSVERFVDDAQVNIFGTLNLLRAVKEVGGVVRIVFASSMAVYADCAEALPISENSVLDPISPYGLSKLTSEKYLMMMAPFLNAKVRIVRYFNTYGSGQSLTPYVGVITIFIKKILSGESPTIFGSGNQRRDFISVHDVVDATIRAMLWEGGSAVFNVGTGKGLSIRELAEMLIGTLSPGLRPVFAEAQAGEIENSIADTTRAKSFLGFQAGRKLQDSIAEIVESVRDIN